MGKTLISDGLLMPCILFYIFLLPWSRWYFDYGQQYENNKKFWKKIHGRL